MYPLTMKNDGSFQPGSAVVAQFDIDFGDLVIVQGTKGRVVSEKDQPLLVRWDGAGDRPVAQSQLAPEAPNSGDDDEEFFLPKVFRKTEVQAPLEEEEEEEKKAVESTLSIARMEENKARAEQDKAKTKSNTGDAEIDATV